MLNDPLVEGKYFRVVPIVHLIGFDSCDNEPIIEECDIKTNGLAIEENMAGYYYVVAFVKPEICDNFVDYKLEDVALRTVDLIDSNLSMEDLWEKILEYKNCVQFAKQMLEDLYGR